MATGVPPADGRARSGGSDLVVASLSNPPASVDQGETFTVTTKVANKGTKKAGASTLGFYLSADKARNLEDRATILDDLPLGVTRSVKALAAGNSSRAKTKVAISQDTVPGSYYLLACADDAGKIRESKEANNCRAAATPVEVVHVPTSQELIAADLEAGVIDYPTSLVYRAYEQFSDPLLPAKYEGGGPIEEDPDVFLEAGAEWDTLPPDTKTLIEPFLVRPDDPKSIFGPEAVASRRASSAGAAEADTKCPTLWAAEDFAHFKVWICETTNPFDDGVLQQAVGAIAEDYYDEMTKAPPEGMGPPKSDGQDGGDGKIDIYLVPLGQCPERESCGPLLEGNPGRAIGANLDVVKDDAGRTEDIRSGSGYLLLDKDLANDKLVLKSVFVHEFFHILQYAHRIGTREAVFYINGSPVWGPKSWFVEASARWAQWRYVPESTATYVHPEFVNVFQKTERPLWFWEPPRGGPHPYSAYIWPFFMQQEGAENGDHHIFEAWVRIENAKGARAIDKALDDQFSFSEHFRDFAVRNLDADLPGDPLETPYWEQDGKFPRNIYPRMKNLGVIAPESVPTSEVDIAPLQAQYDWFAINSQVGKVTFDFSALAPAEDLDFDLVVEIDDDQWKRLEVPGDKISFCRDTPEENVTELFVILSNHNWDRTKQPVGGSYEIKAEDECELPLRYTGSYSGTKEGPQEQGYSGPTERWTATGVTLERVSVPSNDENGKPFQGYNVTGGSVTYTISGGSPCSYDGSATFSLSPEPPQQATGGHLDLEVRPVEGHGRRYEADVDDYSPHQFDITVDCGEDSFTSNWYARSDWSTGGGYLEAQSGDSLIDTYDPPRGDSGDDFKWEWNFTPQYEDE
ncbi:MAG: CARDB domain-containing protein [Actinomycetota bacterium]